MYTLLTENYFLSLHLKFIASEGMRSRLTLDGWIKWWSACFRNRTEEITIFMFVFA